MDKEKINIVLRGVSVVLAAVGGYFIIKWIIIYLYPFVLAFFLTMVIQPVVRIMELKLSLPRALASAIVMVTAIILFTAGLFFLAAEFWQGSVYLARILPEHLTAYTHILQDWFNQYIMPVYDNILSLFNAMDDAQKEALQTQIDQLLTDMSTTLSDFIQQLLLKMPETVSVFSMSVTVMTITLIATFFMAKDWETIKQAGAKWFPATMKSPGMRIWKSFLNTVFGYFRAQVTLVLLSVFTMYIGLILLGIDRSLTIALLIGLVDFVPIIGSGAVFIPWIIFLFLSEQYPMTIGLSLLYMIVVIGRQILEPKILSSHIGINPLAALAGLFVGIKLFGLMGLFITPFFIIIISTFHQTGVFKAIWGFVLYNDYHLR